MRFEGPYMGPRARRRFLHDVTEGRCFYCGVHIRATGDDALPRDWLFLRGNGLMELEHQIPISRGGPNSLDNLIPSCGPCNAEKGVLTRAEFELLTALQRNDFNFCFWGSNAVYRDWIVCHSDEFIEPTLRHNYPDVEATRGRM